MIPWIGGKRREVEELKKYFPKHYDIYGEPFVGGGAMYFNLLPEKGYINDFHKDLMNFYRVIKDNDGKKVYNLMKKIEKSDKTPEERFYYLRDEYRPDTNVEKAFRFLYLLKNSYGSRMTYNKAGKLMPSYGMRDREEQNVKFLLEKDYQKVLDKATLSSKDFVGVMLKNDSPSTFHFCDPPYDTVISKFGKKYFTKNDQKRLADTFYKLKGKCLIVISDTPYIRSLYKKKNIKGSYDVTYQLMMKGTKQVRTKHLIITNY
jgi:DNA adenine methylase